MREYIHGKKNGVHIIDLNKTATQLEEAKKLIREISQKGKKILFVGCKKQAQTLVKDAATESKCFYVNTRWLGGTLTNLTTIRRSVARMEEIDSIDKSPEKQKFMSKQEVSALRREGAKLHRNLDGIALMTEAPAAVIIIDPSREKIAVKESRRLNIPTIALNDTDSDPNDVTCPIPGNDDAIRSIKYVLEHIKDAIVEGRNTSAKSKKDEMEVVATS
jgi:small subunit ribosomal protein S2